MESRWGSAEGTEASRSVRCRDWGEGADSERERWEHSSERSVRQKNKNKKQKEACGRGLAARVGSRRCGGSREGG